MSTININDLPELLYGYPLLISKNDIYYQKITNENINSFMSPEFYQLPIKLYHEGTIPPSAVYTHNDIGNWYDGNEFGSYEIVELINQGYFPYIYDQDVNGKWGPFIYYGEINEVLYVFFKNIYQMEEPSISKSGTKLGFSNTYPPDFLGNYDLLGIDPNGDWVFSPRFADSQSKNTSIEK